jgi:succinyl-CoA synthetase beta subunit
MIHEYQGKEILASYGVRIQRGIVASPRSGCCCKTINNRNGYKLVCCKAQVHAGGRGGGVKLAKTYNK